MSSKIKWCNAFSLIISILFLFLINIGLGTKSFASILKYFATVSCINSDETTLSLEETIENITWTYFEDRFHDDTVSMFPELGNIDKKLSKKEIEDKITELFTK